MRTSTCPPGRCTGAHARPRSRRPASSTTRRRTRRSSSPTATARPVRLDRARARLRQRAERQDRRLVQRHTRHRARRSSASPAPTRSRSSTRSARSCPTFEAQLPAVDQALDVSTTARSRSASRCTTCRSRCCSALVLVVLVIFVFLRSVSATLIPSLALPLSIVGTFAADVRVRLHPRQPVADGADAVRRLRRRRRDRDAREHHAAHGDGQVADGRRRSTARRRSASRSCR